MQTASGEENLECIMKIRAKLFRWRDEQWKERGIGNAKLMRDRAEKQVRFVMRQEKTLKPVANFISKCHSESCRRAARLRALGCKLAN